MLRDNFAPFQGWDLLESAEMSYFTSFVYALLGANQRAAKHLDDAIDAYEALLGHLKSHGMNYRRSRKRLKTQAEQGFDRARAASSGDYDIAWLVPSLTDVQAQHIANRIRDARQRAADARMPKRSDVVSDQAQKPAAEVRGAGGDQAVAETA